METTHSIQVRLEEPLTLGSWKEALDKLSEVAPADAEIFYKMVDVGEPTEYHYFEVTW